MRKKDYKKYFIVGILIVIIVTLFVVCMINKNKSEETSSVPTYSMIGKRPEIRKKVEDEIKEKVIKEITDILKAPDSAKFAKKKDWKFEVDTNNILLVEGYVDSQNTYGAMLRSNFQYKYLFLDEKQFLCIYKKFNDEVRFDITENCKNKDIMNKTMINFGIKEFIDKATEGKYNVLNNNILDYEFILTEQKLSININVKYNGEQYIKNDVNSALINMINECVCIPTVTTTINAYSNIEGKQEKLAVAKDIDINFILKKWNSLANIGLNVSHSVLDFEKEMGENLWQSDLIKQ